MSIVYPELGGVTIYPAEGHELSQTYDNEEGSRIMRMLEGTGIKQFHWSKLRTTISGTGWLPAPLRSIDFTASLTLKCAAHLSATDTDVTVVIPSARRTDIGTSGAICAHAILADGSAVATGIDNVATDTVTCVAVATAVAYRVRYCPQITVFAELSEDISRSSATWSWTLDCEEV